ncbi:endolytic transglycosylase MltG [Salinarimonas soli]|uniref:Endolytic murein transglycosylase n=1 Tax=Salinarimonas soli TaxID=1638099 RepID=A0A5B2VBR6_9HYPH|nr:endolytic transglycosylase MltG [Salinarimonas soli]
MFGRRKDAPPPPPPASPSTSGQMRMAPRSPSEAIKPTTAPPPPPKVRRPRGGLLSSMSAALSLVLFLAVGAMLAVTFVSRQAGEAGPLAMDKVVLIPRNTGVNEIAELLRREGVIAQPTLFELYALLNRQRGALRAGEYQFKANVSIDGALDVLTSGRSILHSFSVPEGLTSQQIIARMMENEILTGEVAEVPPEGSLLPDTYKFERGMTRQQLVASMQSQQRQALNQIWSRRASDLPIKTPQELVILASIVEKETGRADERTRVAGVFVNRLNKRMRLQSDPTIVYGLVGGKGTLGRGITRAEIDRPTPYNTYAVDGLPPGPIANPGRAAMEAVASPSRTRDLYFVADGTGGHAFAESYEQHQRNVARWRQVERSRDAGQAGAAAVDRVEPPPPETRGDAPAAASAFTAAGLPGPARTGSNPADPIAGTARDPLLNNTFDLNSPKNVPIAEEPPAPGRRTGERTKPANGQAERAARREAAKPAPKPDTADKPAVAEKPAPRRQQQRAQPAQAPAQAPAEN